MTREGKWLRLKTQQNPDGTQSHSWVCWMLIPANMITIEFDPSPSLNCIWNLELVEFTRFRVGTPLWIPAKGDQRLHGR